MDFRAGVAEPQRPFWLLTHRTDSGTAREPRYFPDRNRLRSHQGVVAGLDPAPAAFEAGLQLRHHVRHPILFVFKAQPGRHRNDCLGPFPKRGQAGFAPGRPPDHHGFAVAAPVRRVRVAQRPGSSLADGPPAWIQCCCHASTVQRRRRCSKVGGAGLWTSPALWITPRTPRRNVP